MIFSFVGDLFKEFFFDDLLEFLEGEFLIFDLLLLLFKFIYFLTGVFGFFKLLGIIGFGGVFLNYIVFFPLDSDLSSLYFFLTGLVPSRLLLDVYLGD